MKLLRRTLAIVLMLAVFVHCIPVQAEEASTWSQNITTASVGIDISSNGVADCMADVVAKSGCSSIQGALLLYKGSTLVKKWTIATRNEYYAIAKTTTVTSRGTYTLTLHVDVYKNGVPETLTIRATDTY